MRKLLFIICLLIGEGIALPVPAFRGLMKVRQPDGSEIALYKRGDERSHVVFNQEGQMVRQDSLGYWREAGEAFTAFGPQSGTGGFGATASLRSKKSKVITRGPGLFHYAFPVKGKQKGLVILAEFSDVKFNSKNSSTYNKVDPKTYFTEMLNKEGFNTYNATGSARDWFVDNSAGQFEPEFDVFGPVTLPNNMKYYGGNDYYGDDLKPGEMIIDACNAMDAEINFKEYDRDGDGYVDYVYVIYAGFGEADTYESNSIWPHSWTISEATGTWSTPGEPLYLDGVYVDSYGCSNETQGYNNNGVLAKRPVGIGTFVHEFSHVMGLPDLYSTDYDNTDPNKEPFTPGEFSIMDYGPYNNDGLTPPNYSAYERYAFDWIVPEELKVGKEYELKNIADANCAFIVKTDKDREFFLFENRQQNKWDKYIPAHGMLVWHVDFDQTVFYNNEVNNTRNHQYVDIVEADNVQDYPTRYSSSYGFVYGASTQSGDTFPGSGNVTTFGETTAPALVSWSGKSLGLDITDIAEKNGVVSFKVAEVNSQSAVDEIPGVIGIDGDVYTLGGIYVGKVNEQLSSLPAGIYIVRYVNGEVKKIRI